MVVTSEANVHVSLI